MRDYSKCEGPKITQLHVNSQELATLREAVVQLLTQQVNDGRNDEALETIKCLNTILYS